MGSSVFFALFCVFASLLLFWFLDEDVYMCSSRMECAKGHFCDCKHSRMDRLRCAIFRYPVDVNQHDYQSDVLRRLRFLTQRGLKGQRHVVEAVMMDLAVKLEYPDKPLVLHFAGDNGVGKTTLAQLISLALGFHCRDATCDVGDSTLILSGVSYDGFSVQEFRKDVVQKIVRHAATFPRNGVIVINDLGALHPDHVRVLLPLFGRATAFPEAPSILLSPLTVIITTDFGRQGRTQGKSLSEMRRIIEDDFKSLYSQLATSMIQTYPFLPVSLEAAKDIVKMTIETLRCSHKNTIKSIQVSSDAVGWFVNLVYDDLPMENGRCVVNAVLAHVGPGVMQHIREKPNAPLSLHVDVDNDGSIIVTPV